MKNVQMEDAEKDDANIEIAEPEDLSAFLKENEQDHTKNDIMQYKVEFNADEEKEDTTMDTAQEKKNDQQREDACKILHNVEDSESWSDSDDVIKEDTIFTESVTASPLFFFVPRAAWNKLRKKQKNDHFKGLQWTNIISAGIGTAEDFSHPILHRCLSHIMKNAKSLCKKHARNNFKLAMHVFSLLTTATTIAEFDEMLISCTVIFSSPCSSDNNFTQDNKTQGIMEKSQWDLKKIHFKGRRLTRLDDFVMTYKATHTALLREFNDAERITKRKHRILKEIWKQRKQKKRGVYVTSISKPFHFKKT
ncbi:hypothetical protein DNTS_009948, partial [Danionella cerebrum]